MSVCRYQEYCNNDCDKCDIAATEKTVADLSEAFAAISKQLAEIIPWVFEVVQKIVNVCLECYPNKRVVHLAKYARKKRIRKKNRNRIIKWVNSLNKREGGEE